MTLIANILVALVGMLILISPLIALAVWVARRPDHHVGPPKPPKPKRPKPAPQRETAAPPPPVIVYRTLEAWRERQRADRAEAELARLKGTRRRSRRPSRAPRWEGSDEGSIASFTYIDADGVVTERSIRNWCSDGPHIEGFCLLRQEVRTFRKDRIEDWSEDFD